MSQSSLNWAQTYAKKYCFLSKFTSNRYTNKNKQSLQNQVKESITVLLTFELAAALEQYCTVFGKLNGYLSGERTDRPCCSAKFETHWRAVATTLVKWFSSAIAYLCLCVCVQSGKLQPRQWQSSELLWKGLQRGVYRIAAGRVPTDGTVGDGDGDGGGLNLNAWSEWFGAAFTGHSRCRWWHCATARTVYFHSLLMYWRRWWTLSSHVATCAALAPSGCSGWVDSLVSPIDNCCCRLSTLIACSSLLFFLVGQKFPYTRLSHHVISETAFHHCLSPHAGRDETVRQTLGSRKRPNQERKSTSGGPKSGFIWLARHYLWAPSLGLRWCHRQTLTLCCHRDKKWTILAVFVRIIKSNLPYHVWSTVLSTNYGACLLGTALVAALIAFT